MSKPSKHASLSEGDLLNKYISEHWAEKLKAFDEHCDERRWQPSGPKATVKKRSCIYLDGDGDPIARIIVFTRADGSEQIIVIFIVDGDTDYHAYA